MARTQGQSAAAAAHEKRPSIARPVPRVVHQVWVQGEPDPASETGQLVRDVREICKARGWQHLLWTLCPHEGSAVMDLQAIDGEGARLAQSVPAPQVHTALQMLPLCVNRSVQSDLIRFCVLHTYGGLYLDADVQLFDLPPDDLEGAWIMRTGNRKGGNRPPVVNCAVIAQPAGHPFMSRVLAAILEAKPDFYRNPIAGPPFCQGQLGPGDVNYWPMEAWNGPSATYGNHLYRAFAWGSQRTIG